MIHFSLLQVLNGLYSTIDLLSGYWQVGIAEKDKEKTAFITQEGLFEFNVMPFGLCNAPATFQRLMNLTLSGVLWSECLVYLDDIIIFGRTFEEHLSHLLSVLGRLREFGLKAKLSKCNFLQKKVLYLGHIISPEGIVTDPSKTQRIMDWPTPCNFKEVQQFLGLASYYRRFIQKFAEIARPLHRLTERGRDFKWTTECADAFAKLKFCLHSSPILAYPDFTLPFILDTDDCQYGIGAVLSQLQRDVTERVIAFASRVMSKAERKYSVTRKELLAAVTYIHHFRPFLLGRHFVLRTDHGSLQWLHFIREPEGQLARWMERLQEYDFEIQHRKGHNHQNADALSRYPTHLSDHPLTKDHHRPDTSELFPSCFATLCSVTAYQSSGLAERTIPDLQPLQQDDDLIGPILKAVIEKERPSRKVTQGKDRNFYLLLQQWDQLYIQQGLLFRRYEDCHGNEKWAQWVVPLALQKEILNDLHSGAVGGHLGEDKTLNRLRERFYWPGHTEDVRKWCQQCSECAMRKTPVPKQRAQHTNVHPGYPLQLVAMDLLGPLPESSQKNSYVLVVSDYFTR